MIISHRHKFIFFAVPKTGTHAVRQALRAQLGEEDQEQVGLFVQKRFPFPELAEVPHGHINARQIAPVLGESVFGSYFKFAFVRNPYDRFVSYCAFRGRDGAFAANPTALMRFIAGNPRSREQILFRPQSEFLVDEAGKLAIDFAGRTENMQTDYDAICARIGIPTTTLGQVNASPHGPFMKYYDRELRRWVGDFYRRDFEMFDYERDELAAQSA